MSHQSSMSLFQEVKGELARNYHLEAITLLGFLRLLCRSRVWAIILLRMTIRGSRLGRFLLTILFHMEIADAVTLGRNLWLPHPYGIVMARGTSIGDGCAIYQWTTFAEKNGRHKGPTIGNYCVIGAGSVVIGDIVLGSNVKIGPNSVVRQDLEDGTLAFGNPLQIQASSVTLRDDPG